MAEPSPLDEELQDHNFLTPEETPYESARLDSLKTIVDQIVWEAAFNHRMNAIEKQWGGTMWSWLCGHLMSWPYDQRFRLLNVYVTLRPQALNLWLMLKG